MPFAFSWVPVYVLGCIDAVEKKDCIVSDKTVYTVVVLCITDCTSFSLFFYLSMYRK